MTTSRRGFIATLAAALGLSAFIKPKVDRTVHVNLAKFNPCRKSSLGLDRSDSIEDWYQGVLKRTIRDNPHPLFQETPKVMHEMRIEALDKLSEDFEWEFFYGIKS